MTIFYSNHNSNYIVLTKWNIKKKKEMISVGIMLQILMDNKK